MPAVPLPNDGSQQVLDQARAQAVSGLKGQFPDSMLAPPPSGGSLGVAAVGIPGQSAAPVAAPDPGPGAEPASNYADGPSEDAVPAAPAEHPSTFSGFWSTLGNKLASGALEGIAGAERLAVGATSPLMPQQFSDSLFKTIDDTWTPAIQFWQQRQQQAEQAGKVGKGSKIVGGIAEGAAPLIAGPEAFLGASTMQAGADAIDQGADLKAAYTLAGVNLVANAAGMKVPFKSPSVIKRVLLNAGYGATTSVASQYLAKETLRTLGENGTADQINPLDPTNVGTSALVSAIFGALEKPKVAAKFRELGGQIPGQPGPDAVPASGASEGTPKPVAPVERPPAVAAPVAPAEAKEPIAPTQAENAAPVPEVPDHPSAEPLPDLEAQVADMKDPATPRKAVYLSPDNVEQLGPEGIAELAKGSKQIRNFDKKGGVLIVPDVETARMARDLRTAQPDMQKVLGQLTGAGDGKSPADTVVVQGQTPAGAVATEAGVRPDEVPQAVAAVQEQGKTPVVTTSEAAVARREALKEPAPTAEPAAPAAAAAPSPAEDAARARTAEGLGKIAGDYAKRQAMEGRGQEILDEMAEAGRKPNDVAKEFWSKTYFKLPDVVQARFRRELENHSGLTNRALEGDITKGVDNIDLPDNVEHLEGTDRGFVALMDEANRRFADKPEAAPAAAPAVEGPKSALEQTMATLAEQEKPAKGRKNVDLKERAVNVSSAAAALKAAVKEAHARGGVDEALINRGNAAANEALKLGEKSDEDLKKGRGVSQVRVSAIADEMQKVSRLLSGRGQPGDEVKLETRAAEIKARVARKAASAPKEPISAPKESPKPVEEAPAKSSEIANHERDVITVKPHTIRGRELQALTHELGYDPSEIAAEAEKATGSRKGALMAFLQELHDGADINKGWLAHMSALNPLRSKDSPLTRSEHIQLGNLIARYARAEAQEAPHARDAIDNFVNSIRGKRLDERTQAAVHEYAAARRRLEVLKDKIAETSDEDDDNLHDEQAIALARRGNVERPIESLDLRHEPATYADRLWGHIASRLDAGGFRDFLNRSQTHNLHDVLDMAHAAAEPGPARAIISAIRQRVQNVPVHFTHGVLDANTGMPESGTSGQYRYNPRKGINEIHVNLDSLKHPIRVLMHEAVHAATYQYMRANPDSPLAREIERLRQVALDRFQRMTKDPASPLPSDADPTKYHYGLTNADEFMAEAISNPEFQRFLMQSEKYASPMDRVKNIVHKLGEAIRKFFGIHDGPEAALFHNVLDMTGRIMDEQQRVIRLRGEYLSGEGGANLEDARGPAVTIRGNRAELRPDLEERVNQLLQRPGMRERLNDLIERQRLGDHTEVLRSLETDPPRFRNEDRVMKDLQEPMRPLLRAYHYVTKSGTWDRLAKTTLQLEQQDWLVRRHVRLFGSDDPTNPLRRWQTVRDTRESVQNKLAEHATDAGEQWTKLTPAQNKRVGQLMIDSTIWGIDPTVAKDAHSSSTQNQRGYDARYDEFQSRWNNLSPAEQSVYTSVRDANRYLIRQSRKVAIDTVLRAYDDEITQSERELLYAAKGAADYDRLIGDGKQIDLPGINDKVRDALKDLAGLHEIDGPYFHLGREGEHVVEVKPEAYKSFANKDEAQAFVARVRALGPASSAVLKENPTGGWDVNYKAKYVSMHKSPLKAEADADRMRAQGFEVNPVTRKIFSQENAPLTYGMKEVVTEAERRITAHGADEGTKAATQALTNAFVNLLAARSAYAGSKLAREGVAGVKADEMRMSFARHATALAWHTANMGTLFDEAEAMARVREAARKPDVGNADQNTMYQRGRVVSELNRRAQDEVRNYGTKSPYSTVMSKLNYLNFLASPAHAGIWLTQNVTTGLPVLGAKYGYGRATRALMKSSAFMPALRATLKGLRSIPGDVTSTDVTRSVIEALRKNPALDRWTKGENSPLQQLMDRGAINSTLSNELSSMSKGESLLATKTMEWARLLPHMADLYNRISTGIAGLELTNGDVQKTADLIRMIHVDYSSGNQSGFFKQVKRIRIIGPSAVALKTYVQGMTHLMLASMHDAILGDADGNRAEAAKTLAGLYVGSAIFTGLVGSTPFPARLMAYGYHQLFGDSDEFYSLDNQIQRWCSEVFGQQAGRLIANGLPRALGIDVSHRMGLADLPFHDFPDLLSSKSATDKLKDLVFSLAGTLPQALGQALDSWTMHMERGEPAQAVLSSVPVKVLHDVQKAYDQAVSGVRTRQSGQVLGPESFSGVNTVEQALGFKPTAAAEASDREHTAFEYHDWAAARRNRILAQYAAATDKSDVMSEISDWNAKNPGMRITRSDIIRQMASAQRARAVGTGGMTRDPKVNELLNY